MARITFFDDKFWAFDGNIWHSYDGLVWYKIKDLNTVFSFDTQLVV
jgi:hypothetical protein